MATAEFVTGMRRRLRPMRAAARTLLDVADPSRFVRASEVGERVGFACVYRERNAELVRRLVVGLPAGAEVRLWSLDDVPSALAGATIGRGPGTRFELLNRLIASIPLAARKDALVLCDDDVRFVAGDVRRLVALGRSLGLDVFQPAHARTSFMSLSTAALVRKRPLVLGRSTTFVEQGPVLVLDAGAQQALLPLPEDVGMAWGIEVRWARQAPQLRFGIVDATPIRHMAPPAAGYDTTAEIQRLEAELLASGVTSLDDVQQTLSTARVLPSLWRGLRPLAFIEDRPDLDHVHGDDA